MVTWKHFSLFTDELLKRFFRGTNFFLQIRMSIFANGVKRRQTISTTRLHRIHYTEARKGRHSSLLKDVDPVHTRDNCMLRARRVRGPYHYRRYVAANEGISNRRALLFGLRDGEDCCMDIRRRSKYRHCISLRLRVSVASPPYSPDW